MTRLRTTLLAAVATTIAGAVLAPMASAVPTYYPFGPRADVNKNELLGWTPCYSGDYGQTTALAPILAACDGPQLLLAAGRTGNPVLDVVAAAPRADVIFDTGTGNTPHNANGTGWYFNSSSSSWGFAKQGDAINRATCDTGVAANAELRLCWHTGAGTLAPGWRSGANESLFTNTYERFIYEPATAATATPSPTGLTFASQPQSTVSPAQTVTIANSGTDRLSFNGIQLTGANPGDFFVGRTDCVGSAAGPSSCTIDVRFAPQASGARSATMAVLTSTGTTSIPLTGSGGSLPQGPQGSTGPQGPAGPAATVTCVVKKKGGVPKVKCKVTYSAQAAGKRLHWRLRGARGVVERGAKTARRGGTAFAPGSHLDAGRYRLTVTYRVGDQTVKTRTAFRIR